MPVLVFSCSITSYHLLSGLKNIHLVVHSSIGQNPGRIDCVHEVKIKVLARLGSYLEIPEKNLFPGLFKNLPEFSSVWL